MNTLIANQYGRVEGEAARNALTLSVTAQTPRRESVQLQTCIDAVEQQLHLLAILRAVERRIEQFQLRDAKTARLGTRKAPSMKRSAARGTCSTRTARHRRTRCMAAFPSSSSTNRWTKAGSGFSLRSATRPSASLGSTSTPERFRPCTLWLD